MRRATLVLASVALVAAWSPARADDTTTLQRRGVPNDSSSVQEPSGARHDFAIAYYGWRAGHGLTLRAGVGLAEYAPQLVLPSHDGVAAGVGASMRIWKRHRFTLDVDVGATTARYQGGDGFSNEAVMLVLRAGPRAGDGGAAR